MSRTTWDEAAYRRRILTETYGPDFDKRRLFIARWGTQSALVIAPNALWAIRKVRRQALSPKLSLRDVAKFTERVRGEVTVRLATESDLVTWELAGGTVSDELRSLVVAPS